MAHKMKYTKGGFPFKTDLTKKKGLGPRRNESVRVSNKNKTGGYVSEDELESKFKKKGGNPKNYPQLSVQDYSKVKEDDMGKYVEPLRKKKGAPNYMNPQDYKVFNMGNKPTPVNKKKY